MVQKRKKQQSYFPEEDLLTEEEKLDQNIQRKTKLIAQIRKDIIIKIAVFLAAFFVTFTFIFGVTKAPTNDMFPAIHAGDVVVYYRLGQVKSEDVCVYETEDGMNVGRAQAAAGSAIDATDGGLLEIDGNIQPIQKRSGLFYKTYIREDGALEYPSVVPEDAYVILGDERDSARDSRQYGYITKDQIKGKVFTIIRRRPL